MKYEITATKTETFPFYFDADSPEEAMKIARSRPREGWRYSDTVTQVDGALEPIAEHTLFATCENCDAMVFDEAEYNKGAEGDDGFLCEKCHAAFLASQARDALKHLPTAGL